MKEIHGGDITGYRLQYGVEPLDFSASLNACGMPLAVRQAALAAVADSYAYPDPQTRELCTALARKLMVPTDHLMLGNGAADLIYRYVYAIRPKRALLPVPSFAIYERALSAARSDIAYYALQPENHFDLDAGILEAITTEVDVLFLCQPNNPTGRLVAPDLLAKILAKCCDTGTRLFLDECFLSFVQGTKDIGTTARCANHPNLFVLGSFTKLYGMAGLRLGWGVCSDETLRDAMLQNGQPWAVSTVAQAAGLAALTQDAWVQESLATIREAKRHLVAGLRALGFSVLGGAANYLFFKADDVQLKQKLAEQGILIRDCCNFRGLTAGHYRVAVRSNEENNRLLQALATVRK